MSTGGVGDRDGRKDLDVEVHELEGPGELAVDRGGPDGWRGSALLGQMRQRVGRLDIVRADGVFGWVALGLFFFLVVQYFWNPPLGIWVQGMIIGGLTSLVAFGISLVYRANRIINFAQGDLGGVPASLAVLLIVGSGVPYFLALPTAIAAAVALGLIVEVLIIRRFFRAPRLILTVVTIGLVQVLAGASLILPRAFDIDTPPQSFPSPFDFSFRIAPIIFRGNDIIAMLAVPVAIAGLVAFFRYTNIGIAVRASAENADRASLCGVPVKRIHTIVWILATVLATVAMFLRAGIIGLPIGSVLGPAILLRALAAAVIGRMERLPTIFVASVALGIVEQSIVWHTARSILVDPILFGVVIVALLLQRRREVARSEDAQMSTWQAAQEIRPIPRELAGLPEVRYGLLGLYGALAIFLLTLPAWLPESRVNLAGVILIFGIVGVSLVVLTGWAGQVSLGQVAFVGIGAAVAGALTTRFGIDVALAVALAGVAGAIAAMVIGLPALRIRGLFLAVTTLAFALATSSYLLNREFFGWWLPQGRVERLPLLGSIDISTETRYYYLTLLGFGLALVMVRGVRRSRTGRVLIGTRENERAAQAYGVNITRAKLTAFAISGFLAAYAGGLFVHHQQSLGIAPFTAEQSLRAFTMVVIGGLGSVPGALLGALYVRGGIFFLPPAFQFFTGGVGLILILMVLPGGLGSVMYQIRDWALRRIAHRHQLIVPSLVADVREDSERAGRLASPLVLGLTAAAGDGSLTSDGTGPTVPRAKGRGR